MLPLAFSPLKKIPGPIYFIDDTNLKTDNGRSLIQQPIQYPLIPGQPTRSVVTFTAILILLSPHQNTNQ